MVDLGSRHAGSNAFWYAPSLHLPILSLLFPSLSCVISLPEESDCDPSHLAPQRRHQAATFPLYHTPLPSDSPPHSIYVTLGFTRPDLILPRPPQIYCKACLISIGRLCLIPRTSPSSVSWKLCMAILLLLRVSFPNLTFIRGLDAQCFDGHIVRSRDTLSF
jgi:hypothetical protein